MRFTRGSGILLHPTSLPGKFGVGDFGRDAFEFVDFLVAAGQKYWQILPLTPTGQGNSPYSSFSAFAGNTLLISPEKLVEDGLLEQKSFETAPKFSANRVDYDLVKTWKAANLDEAFTSFRASENDTLKNDFAEFVGENSWWLDDYSLFVALKNSHAQQPWFEWAEPLQIRDKSAIDGVASQFAREIQAEKFAQFLFFRQWNDLKKYANDNGVAIIGDIPIFVAMDSADVWCNQSKFKLNTDGTPKVVAGVPPDYFSKTGQLWGTPVYDWQAMLADNFGWWTARVAFALRMTDVVRLDHFIGFVRNWEVPATDKTAENGSWQNVPGHEFFTILTQRIGQLPVIAEDLGSVTPEVEALRDEFGFPGMKILQYAFGGDAQNLHLPHNYQQNCVVYTGTHDNDTTAGWYKTAPKNVKAHARKYLNSSVREVNWAMIRAASSSVADLAIFPMQDILGLGSDARMNTPATEAHNWEWCVSQNSLTEDLAETLLEITKSYGRAT